MYKRQYLAYRDKECGALIPGRFADLAILDRDILDGDPEGLLKTRVAATMLDGKFLHFTEDAPVVPEEFTEIRT